MSPGLMPRPSLSAPVVVIFVSRHVRVSPGLKPRPSLSGNPDDLNNPRRCVSPGLMPRPSLSGWAVLEGRCLELSRVAGVDAPAFVERGCQARRLDRILRVSPGLMPRPSLSADALSLTVVVKLAGVAGVDAPAFVERRCDRWLPPRRGSGG